MAKPKVLTGLDMGGGRVACVLAEQDAETRTVKALASSCVYCRGLKGGVVVDIKETASAVAQAVERCEKTAAAETDEVYLGIRGVHLQSQNNHGAYNISRADKEINSEDVQSAIENAKAVPIANDREIIHVIPQSFSIDRQRGVPNPEGMEGSLLEADVHIVTASSSHLNNLIKSVAKAGFKVEESFYSLLALAECVLTAEEKELGATLIDMGGETISIAIYVDGGIKFSKDIPYGCDLITRDIAYGLHTSREAAREIKEKYGVTYGTLLGDDEEIPVPSLDRRTTHSVKSGFLLDIIQPRVEELFDKVREEIQRSRYADIPGVGVITGGGSLLRGTAEQCAQRLGLREVRSAGVQRELTASGEEFFSPALSTALSLVLYPSVKACDMGERSGSKRSALSGLANLFSKLEIFGRD